mmetsp:Transcript_453/g.598  ORF Transcript_453/g.598 Transcript_453/m.598 type:complete len:205 (-) Transcript_453:249-863(-)
MLHSIKSNQYETYCTDIQSMLYFLLFERQPLHRQPIIAIEYFNDNTIVPLRPLVSHQTLIPGDIPDDTNAKLLDLIQFQITTPPLPQQVHTLLAPSPHDPPHDFIRHHTRRLRQPHSNSTIPHAYLCNDEIDSEGPTDAHSFPICIEQDIQCTIANVVIVSHEGQHDPAGGRSDPRAFRQSIVAFPGVHGISSEEFVEEGDVCR